MGMRGIRRLLWNYWGYVAIVIAGLGFWNGVLSLEVAVGLSALASGYFSFAVPVRCGAPGRDGSPCRNNARGLLLGCNQVRMHKTLKLKMLISRSRWAQFGRAMWNGTQTAAAALANLATVLSAAVGVVALVVT